jgi:hypothetical protein
MHGAITPFPQHAFMTWCSVKAQGLYLYLYPTIINIGTWRDHKKAHNMSRDRKVPRMTVNSLGPLQLLAL